MRAHSVVTELPRFRSPAGSAYRRRSGGAIDIRRKPPVDKLAPDVGADRAALQARLVLLEQQIARGRAQFARQLDIVAGIERRQADSTTAREMLHLFAQAHVLRLDNRDRLARLLEGAPDGARQQG